MPSRSDRSAGVRKLIYQDQAEGSHVATQDENEKRVLVTGATALVSGATGFLGGVLAGMLQKRGYRVRALARRTSDLSRLEALGVEIVIGDLDDPASLKKATQDQALVFHTAGKVSDWGKKEEFFKGNRDGTRNIIRACHDSGVERLVHLSSLTVLGLPRDGRLVDENSPYASSPPDPYTQSKIAGEKLVREIDGSSGLSATVIRPGVIWGPGDITIVPRIVALLRQGRMIYLDQSRNLLGLSHVENLGEACLLAANNPACAGQTYNITDGEEITAREVIDRLADLVEAPRPRRSLPFWAAYAMATLMEKTARVAGRTQAPPMTPYGVRLVACNCRYDLSKAKRDLAYQPRIQFNEGIAEMAGEFDQD
jgi:nucleoside-diphosphate-sugar epimerase